VSDIKRGYKVVRVTRTGARSAVDSIYGVVQYTTEGWTEPGKDCGPLCAFDSKDHAEGFMGGHRMFTNYHVVEIEYEPSDLDRVWRKIDIDDRSGRLDPSYRPTSMTQLAILPEGTVLASRIRVTSPIPEYEGRARRDE